METTSFLKVLIERFKSKNLEFFNVIIYYMGIIGSIGLALVALPEFTRFPDWLQTVGSVMIGIGSAGAFVANLTTKSPSLREKAEQIAKK